MTGVINALAEISISAFSPSNRSSIYHGSFIINWQLSYLLLPNLQHSNKRILKHSITTQVIFNTRIVHNSNHFCSISAQFVHLFFKGLKPLCAVSFLKFIRHCTSSLTVLMYLVPSNIDLRKAPSLKFVFLKKLYQVPEIILQTSIQR